MIKANPNPNIREEIVLVNLVNADGERLSHAATIYFHRYKNVRAKEC